MVGSFTGSLSYFKRDLEGIVDSYNNGEIKTEPEKEIQVIKVKLPTTASCGASKNR